MTRTIFVASEFKMMTETAKPKCLNGALFVHLFFSTTYDFFNDLLKESDEERYDYKRFQPCDKKFLRFFGINNAKDWDALSRERKKSLLKKCIIEKKRALLKRGLKKGWILLPEGPKDWKGEAGDEAEPF